MRKNEILPTDNSLKPFRNCRPTTIWPDVIDIFTFISEIAGLLLNLLTAILLFRLHHGPKLSLQILQTLIIHCFMVCLINFLEDVNPFDLKIQSNIFNMLFCFLWNSRFFICLFEIAAVHCIVFFSVDRALVLLNLHQFRYTSSINRVICYEVAIHLFSLTYAITQIFTVSLHDGECFCAPTWINFEFLTIIYASVFFRFMFLHTVSSSLLLTSGYYILKWTKNTPLDHQFDELNAVTFHENEKVKITGKGRMTASMCVLPMAVSHILTFHYDATYQFFGAVGLVAYSINSPQQKIGDLLLVFNANVIPLILIVYFPPLREFVLQRISAAATLIRQAMTRQSSQRQDDMEPPARLAQPSRSHALTAHTQIDREHNHKETQASPK